MPGRGVALVDGDVVEGVVEVDGVDVDGSTVSVVVLTDGGGGPSGLAAEGAHRNDANMVQATLTSIPVQRPMPTARDATTDIEQPYPGAM